MKKITIILLVVMVTALGTGFGIRAAGRGGAPVEVVHWTNGHLMRPGLMKEMATQFNQAKYRTASGKLIHVQVINHGSAELADDLLSRVTKGVPTAREIPDPVVVTPSSADWLIDVNEGAGRTVVDLNGSPSIVNALIGIVTYRDMAEALGWPDKAIGYADIVSLRQNPRGWASLPGAKAEWGQTPLVAFTDPVTSSTGRSVLFSLYAIGAGKTPEELTLADVTDPAVVDYVKQFQSLIDHYMTGTIPLNTKVYQGPRYGHFFLMPEDNLVHLYEGTEFALINGVSVQAPAITKPMVMIYPKEGSMIRNNIAGFVQASWVTEEQQAAAEIWVDFLRADAQQRAFMRAGFRPGTPLALTDASSKITGKYGLAATPDTPVLSPERIDPAVAAAIEGSWQDVKRPAIVTFVLDISGSMSGTKLEEAKQGMIRSLDGMAQNNQVGFLTFSSTIGNRITVAPLTENRYPVADAVRRMTAQNSTALYDGIKAGIEMTDSVPGEKDAIRAVVVLTDGQANTGQNRLDTLVKMISRYEMPIGQFQGFEGETTGIEIGGRRVAKQDIIGSRLALKTEHPIQVFFIGIGKDADMEVGRILAQATGAEFQGVTEKDLANLLEEFSKYF